MYQNYREISSPLQAVWDVLDTHLATTPSVIRMVFSCAGFLLITVLLLGPYALVASIRQHPAKRAIARLWFAACTKITGMTITVRGTAATSNGVLYVANHVSYLDIIIFGQLLDTRFIAKSDVAGWPLFGLLARLSDTLFITRDRKKSTEDSKQIEAAINNSQRLLMFPEGTSSDGRTVLPFKSSLFSAVEPAKVRPEICVQPVAISYTSYADGRALTGSLRDLYAWYGDMTLFGHLMTVFGLKGASVEVRFLPPIRPAAFADRKQLAAACETAVRTGLNSSQ